MTSGRVAVVDCGTNTTRLLVTGGQTSGDEPDDVRLERVTGLGRGVHASGRLSEKGIERVVAALREFRLLINEHDVDAIRVIATSAARDAVNRSVFFDAAADVIGCGVDLLSGEAEATYGFAGATADLDPAGGPYLVVDIGGGSTELACGRNHPDAVRSLEVGSVRFTEAYLPSDPPRPEELSSAISMVHLYLDDVDRELPTMGSASQLVGVAGTVTTIAAVEIGLQTYDPDVIDGFVLERSAVEEVFRTLATESLADRLHNPGLHPQRAEVIVGGCCILVAIMRHWDLDTCLVRERDLLDGIAAEMLAGRH